MADSVVLRQEEAPAYSDADVAMMAALEEKTVADDGSLLAGKYTSVAELEKAYQELQSQYSRDRNEPEEEEGEEEEYESESDGRSATEIYGDLIGGKLEEAGVDFAAMNEYWQANSELTQDHYDELSAAGFSNAMVKSYLSGLSYQAAADHEMSAQQLREVKATVGGNDEYQAMSEWAVQNCDHDDLRAYNELINRSPVSVIKLAVAGMYAQYLNAEGREAKLYGGRSAASAPDKFESNAQVVEAMSDPKYHTDLAYRNKLYAKIARSPDVL